MPTLTAGHASVQVDQTHGARLTSLLVQGHELLVQPTPDSPGQPSDPLRWGCFPMVPFAGRVRDGRFAWGGTTHDLARNLAAHAIHGTAFDRPWQLEPAEAGYLRFRTPLRPGWPYDGWAIQELALTADRLDLRLEVHTDSAPFPATCGWHPWFRRRIEVGGSLQVDLDATRWYPKDEHGIPQGHLEPVPPSRPWDDCFTGLTWPVTLTWPGALSLSIMSTCDHVVLYDQPIHAICVEPQTGPPDALNHLEWARIVRPHRPLVAETSLIWSTP